MMYKLEGLYNSDIPYFTIIVPELLLFLSIQQAFLFKEQLALPNIYIKVSQLKK